MSASPRLLKTLSRAADDATADCSATMKSMKPSGIPVDEPKAFHHVIGLLARPLVVKKEAGKGIASSWKATAAGRKASSSDWPLIHSLDLLKGQPVIQVRGVKHIGNQVAGLDDNIKPLLDFVAVILQDWLIEEVHEDVAGIRVLSLCPRSKAGETEEVHEDVAGISNGGLVTLPQV